MEWLREVFGLWGVEGIKLWNTLRWDAPNEWPLAYVSMMIFAAVVLWFMIVFMIAISISAMRRRFASRYH